MRTDGTLSTADCADRIQVPPMILVDAVGGGSTTRGLIASGISAPMATSGTGRCELKFTKNSRAASDSVPDVYTTANPGGFQRPPAIPAPFPSNAVAA